MKAFCLILTELKVPDWTEEFDVAMRTADPSTPKEKWKLTDGFLAAEGQDIIACLSKSRPNLLENHMCVLLSCYLRCQLPKALIQVTCYHFCSYQLHGGVIPYQLNHFLENVEVGLFDFN